MSGQSRMVAELPGSNFNGATKLQRSDSHMKPSIALTAATLVLASLVACGEDKPAVCGSVDSLKTSVNNVKNIDVTSSSGVSDLQSGLTTVKSDLAAVKADAKAEFSSEIETVDKTFAALETSVEAAKAAPSASTLAAAGSALSALGTSVETLISNVQSTC